jgi:Kef-type K+ transport system membrane component KefB/nucleotide-binding universal stress UspA family protein/mannitol/fructose-specific phosphotransferase system IIA component (Ntr-type)
MLIALIAPIVSSRFGLPGIIGLIVSGILLGPHGFCVLDRGVEIQLLGSVGLLYIMFLAGLELDRVQFMRHRRHSLVFGALTFIIPLLLGVVSAKYLLGFNWQASILLASMFSSHTLLTYPIASRLGLSRQRSVTTAVGGTIITDIAAMLVLAVIAAIHKGEPGLLFWPGLFMYIGIYTAAMFVILPFLLKWFFRSVATDGIIAFTGVLAVTYFCSYMAYTAGLEPIIGAFFAGIVLNNFIPEKSALMSRIQFVGHSMFIPFFLISIGMLVDLGVLFAPGKALAIAMVMVLAVIASKWAASYVVRRLLRYSQDEAMLIYGLSVNQAAATLAVVLVGYNIGIFSEPVLAGTIIMILATCLAGSLITDRFARKVALKQDDEPLLAYDVPHRILIPLVNSKTAKELMELAVLLRRRNSHEPLYPLTVVQSGNEADGRVARAEKLLSYVVIQAIEADVPVVPVTRAAIDALAGICQAAVDLRISLIIIGWKGSSSSNARVFGRILDSILDNTSQMVFVSRCMIPLNTMKRVVLAIPALVDHQPGFSAVVRAVKILTRQLGASLLITTLPSVLKRSGETIARGLPAVKESYSALEKWDELLPWAKKNLTKDDLFVMVNVRKGRLAWQPALNRLPQLVSRQIDDVNLIVAYPPETAWDEDRKIQEQALPGRLLRFPRENIRLDLGGYGIFDAITRLLMPEFAGKETQLKEVSDKLQEIAKMEPMELNPGMVLLHAHITGIKRPSAFLGLNKIGWRLARVNGDIKVLFILLSERDACPEIHLKALADLVRPFCRADSVVRLMQSVSPEEILNEFALGGTE